MAGLPVAEIGTLASQGEAAGFDTLAVGEAAYDSLALAALVGAATRRARVMTTVTTWVRPPVATATGAATLCEVAPGRFALGLGTMPAAWNRDWYGIEPDPAAPRMREYVACVRGALGPGPFDFDGRFFAVRGYRRPVPAPPAPPIHLAATRPRMAALAAEVADGVIYNVITTRAWIAEVLAPAAAAAAPAGAMPLERGVMLRVVFGTGERARAQARAAVAGYVEIPYLADVLAHSRLAPADATGAALDQLVIVGELEAVAEQLAGYADLVDWALLAPPRLLPRPDLEAWYATAMELPRLLA